MNRSSRFTQFASLVSSLACKAPDNFSGDDRGEVHTRLADAEKADAEARTAKPGVRR